ncbi:MAG TPA: hypothetical protein VFQ44_21830 [Streptosporangiaceae bacterium]|nr:hypothetical protein [Streptosporangiaceae bacterium]
MRTIQWSGHPIGDAPPASPSTRTRPEFAGPATDADRQHFGSRLLDQLGARHARQLAHAEDQWMAKAGELKGARTVGARFAASDLREHLADDWVLFRNLRTAAGGIGQLLLGPGGLVAMTSMYLNAATHCHGDKWHAAFFDQPHERTARLSLDDQDGRSPSQQLNQAADMLGQFLLAAGHQVRIERVILLNHPRSGEGSWHRPAVRVFGDTADFLTWLSKLPETLDPGQKRQLEVLLAGKDRPHP